MPHIYTLPMSQITGEEQIRADLEQLKAKVDRLNTSNTELSAKRDADPAYIEAEQKFHDAQSYRIELGRKMSEMRKQASDKILIPHSGFASYASYTKDYSGKIDTNIRPEVIEAIKANLSINKLKGSQVEKIASDLISMIVSSEDINISGQFVMAKEQEDQARNHLQHVKSMFYLSQQKRQVWTYDYEKEIKRLEEVLADPVKLKKEIERALIPSKLPDIYNALKAKEVVA